MKSQESRFVLDQAEGLFDAMEVGWRSKLFALIVASSLMMALCSCQSAFNWGETSPAIDTAGVVGTWSARGPHGEVSTIDLRDDGSAVISGLPVAATAFDAGPLDWSDTVGSVGRWSVELQTYGEVWSVNISATYPLSLVSLGDEDGDHLAAYIGDADERVRILFDHD